MTRKEQIIAEIKKGIENGDKRIVSFSDCKEVLAKLETVEDYYFGGDNAGWDAGMFVFMNSHDSDDF